MVDFKRVMLTERERKELEALRAAARKFIAKVERGEARSITTYAELKDALAIGEQQ